MRRSLTFLSLLCFFSCHSCFSFWSNWWHQPVHSQCKCSDSYYGCDGDALFPCSTLFQHEGQSSGTKLIMHRHGHAHTLMHETRKDTFFLQRTRLGSSTTYLWGLCLASHVLAMQDALTLVIQDSKSCWFFILAIRSGTVSHLVKVKDGSRKQAKNNYLCSMQSVIRDP